ncbi:hypothetical protein DM01DRAFT_1051115 [Hesseltinella vesiculosa]|uniref:GATA-type domain-containing protein n=1 Tax=Hesseltinella vesiculosa TaxID=101127 RepID=A0A1X2GG72_9FUNG|nr:hypothetical protein DM01DRAFT_1051115 [Hesseltinella vesiculosa]
MESAIISYDTASQQKQLVKDVFFSPAMEPEDDAVQLTDGESIISLSSDITLSTCPDNDNDQDPSDLLDHHDDLLFSGDLDLDLHRHKRHRPLAPPAKKKLDLSPKSTPPMSPSLQLWEEAFDTSSEEEVDTSDDLHSPSPVYHHDLDHAFTAMADHLDPDTDDDLISDQWEPALLSMEEKPKRGRKRGRRSSKKPIKMQPSTKKTPRLMSPVSPPDDANAFDLSPSSWRPADTTCMNQYDDVEQVEPRPTAVPTVYQKLTKAHLDWCRYCGTTEGVNWRPGPWGKRTLSNTDAITRATALPASCPDWI